MIWSAGGDRGPISRRCACWRARLDWVTRTEPSSSRLPAEQSPTKRNRRRTNHPRTSLHSSRHLWAGRVNAASTASSSQRDTVRLVTLTGAGGVGKTRLALQIAGEMRVVFNERVYFVPLASLRDHNLVLATIAHALGLTDSSNEPPLARLTASLKGKRTLLVLDNLEHLLDVTPAVNELLIHCSELTILVTSRAALSLSGEHEFVVPPLEPPEPSQSDDLSSLMRNPAVALLLDRLSMNDPGFTPTGGDVSAIIEICRRTDGLPLAIELAAARARHMTLPELAERLRYRLDLLSWTARFASSPTDSARHDRLELRTA